MSVITDSPVRVAGIILAAGQSSRMGRCKALLPLEGRPVISHVTAAAAACGPPVLDPLVVVLGAYAHEIRSCLDTGPAVLIHNPDYASGMASSIKAGLDHISGSGCTGALFILGDQPRIPAKVFTRIIRASARYPGRILIPTFGGTAGNPVLFDRRFFTALRKLSGDVGGRALFSRYPEALCHIPVSEPGICRDLDTWDDYLAMAGDGTKRS